MLDNLFPLFLGVVKTDKELNKLELFYGIEAIRKALIRKKILHQIIDYIEIDKNCVKSNNTMYNEDFERKSTLDYNPPDKRMDLLMHGRNYQDFSRS